MMNNIHIKYFSYILTLSFSILVSVSQAQSSKECHQSTEGKDFWIGFMSNRYLKSKHELSITITSKTSTTGEIYLGKENTPFTTFSVEANSSAVIDLSPQTDYEVLSSEESGVFKGIHVVTDDPVNVYALNYQQRSSDATLIFPTSSLGTDYYAMCYTPSYNGKYNGNETGRNSEFLIVATEDTTLVTITPSRKTDQGRTAGDPYTLTLHKGESYQVQSANTDLDPLQGDLTGSRIISDKKIALFSGNYATVVPEGATSAWDHLYEQIPSVNLWGKEYVTVPMKTREWDTFRAMAAYDDTQLFINGKTVATIHSGEFYEFNTQNDNTPRLVQATNPILLAHYSNSKSADGVDNSDPFMIILSPTAQKVEKSTFEAFESEIIKNYYVNIVTSKSNKSGILIDGTPVSGFEDIARTDFAFARLDITEGTHNLESTTPGEGFLAYVYGYGSLESYGYNAGADLDVMLDLSSSENDTLMICKGDTASFFIGENFDNIYWTDGSEEEIFNAYTDGKYWVTASAQGCELSDTVVIVTIEPPKPDLGPDRLFCEGDTLLFNANKGHKYYQWENGSEETERAISEEGKYWLTIGESNLCYRTDTLQLTIAPPPEITLPDTINFCGLDTFTISAVSDLAADGFWESLSPSVAVSKRDKLTGAFKVPDYGNHTLVYTALNSTGCANSDTVIARVRKIPSSFFSIDSISCKGYNYTFTYMDIESPDAQYYWDFDLLEVQEGDGAGPYVVSAGSQEAYPVNIKLYVTEKGCTSDTTELSITEFPQQRFNFSPKAGCVPLDVHFNTDKHPGDTYQWEFGDGNIDSGAEIHHQYATAGKYKFNAIVTSAANCVNTFSDSITVYPKPEVMLNIDNKTCYRDTLEVAYIGSDSIINYNWDFSDFDSDAVLSGSDAGPYQLTAKGEDLKKVGLSITSHHGCISEPFSVDVNFVPTVDRFETDPAEGCLPLDVTFKGVHGDKYNYTWELADGTMIAGDGKTHTFIESGKHNFIYRVKNNSSQCTQEKLFEEIVEVYPLPEIDLLPERSVFLTDYQITFENQGVNSLSHEWNFGEGTTSNENLPQHTYDREGNYTVHVTATSDHGCKQDGEKDVEILLFHIDDANTILPNSINDTHRCFSPVNPGLVSGNYSLMIFNRWGEKIYDTQEPIDWCGVLKDGSPAPAGSYTWKLKFTDILEKEHKKMGAFLIIR